MNFTDFTKDIAKEYGISETFSKKLLVSIQKKMKRKLVSGHEISFNGIGRFKHIVIEPRPFLNLQTGKMQMSNKRFKLKFETTRSLDTTFKNKTIF